MIKFNKTKIPRKFKAEEKPPLGITPRFIHDESRIDQIEEAIQRFCDTKKLIPEQWIIELAELYIRRQNKHK